MLKCLDSLRSLELLWPGIKPKKKFTIFKVYIRAASLTSTGELYYWFSHYINLTINGSLCHIWEEE